MSDDKSKSSKVTHVTLTFDRELTDEEVKQMQMQHRAVAVSAVAGGHHHDHDPAVM